MVSLKKKKNLWFGPQYHISVNPRKPPLILIFNICTVTPPHALYRQNVGQITACQVAHLSDVKLSRETAVLAGGTGGRSSLVYGDNFWGNDDEIPHLYPTSVPLTHT